jgi:drug/metabolite transporter (DMT)-like permease
MVGGILWNFGVSRIGIVRASLYLNLIPISGLLCAAAFGNYPSLRQLAGCLLVLLGVGVILRRRGTPAAADESA